MQVNYHDMPAYRLRRIAESILDLAEALFARHFSIKALDWRVLAKLDESSDSISTEIARDMLLTPVQTGRSLQKLRELGLVEALPDPEDGRATRYRLTPAGQVACEAGMKIVLAVQEHALRGLSPVETVALDGLLGRLVQESQYNEDDVERLSAALFGKPRKRS